MNDISHQFLLYAFLQIWGGACYLSNKICFSRAERSQTDEMKRAWRIRSWAVYLAGVPAWVIVFVGEQNWIAASIEAGGTPSMAAGLVMAARGKGDSPKWLDRLAQVCIVFGIGISVSDNGGFTLATQYLELGVTAGFLLGTYFMAKQKSSGYLWLMLGNVSCAALMGLQGYYLLMVQQTVSLVFVTDGYRTQKRNCSEIAI